MKPSVYREFYDTIKTKLVIIKASIVYTYQEDTAYVAENWASILSTFAYVVSFALFIKILYSNIDALAGYTENEMLLFLFISQSSFYTQIVGFDKNIVDIGGFVNSGALDLYLVKPLPILFYLSLKRISIITAIREVIPALFFLGILIDWSGFAFTVGSTVYALIVFICGIIVIYNMSILAMLPVFWLGRSEEIYLLSHRLYWLGRREIPFEGFSPTLRIVFSSIIPILISTGLTTSVLLGKTDGLFGAIYAFTIMLITSLLVKVLWNKALIAYTSASS